MKTKLTKQEYLAAYALLHSAQEKLEDLIQLEESLNEILGLDDSAYVSDAIYGGYSLDKLLKTLNLKSKSS